MAGAIAGNLNPQWRDIAKALTGGGDGLGRYLSGRKGSKWCMDVYLAGIQGGAKGFVLDERLSGGRVPMEGYLSRGRPKIERERERAGLSPISILESYYYTDETTEAVIPMLERFLLDSGAFTFMQNSKTHVDWVDYLDGYIDFINRNNVKTFFELDIDSVVGYERVLELRKRLEDGTGMQCIPVWHKSRGKEEFLRMCDEYPYVAVGGIVSKEITPSQYGMLPWFVAEAHKRGARIHGLGFTHLKWLKTIHWDSVDSTAWLAGNRFGHVCEYSNGTVVNHRKPEGARMTNVRELAVHNFNEWVKYQAWARDHL